MDEVVAILKRAFNGESGTVAGLAPRSMIRACISTLGLNIGNAEILGDQGLDEIRQTERNVCSVACQVIA